MQALLLLAVFSSLFLPGGSQPTPPTSNLLLWLKPESLGSAAACPSTSVGMWANSAPNVGASTTNIFIPGADSMSFVPPARMLSTPGVCVPRFTGSVGTLLCVPELDLTGVNTSYSVTIVARMWSGQYYQRVLTNFYQRSAIEPQFWLGWHNGIQDQVYLNAYASGEPVQDNQWRMNTFTRTASSGGASCTLLARCLPRF